MQRTLLWITCATVLIATGIVHGLWTDRWADDSEIIAAGQRLETIPHEIGRWKGTDFEMKQDLKLNLAGQIARRYVHQDTGKTVSLYLNCGRPGPVAIHTPDVCYECSGYEVEKRVPYEAKNLGVERAEFFTSRMKKHRATEAAAQLRIFWGWRADDRWQIAENPRWAFVRERMLHKIYVIREMVHADEPLEGDGCVEFMRELLPLLEQTLFREKA